MNPSTRPARNPLTPTLVALCLGAASVGFADRAAAIEWEPKARLHLDYAHYDADTEPLAGGWSVRRATLGLEGKFNHDWSFEIGYGIANDGALRPHDGKFRDVALEYEGWAAGDLRLGQFKLPFGLEELTSSNDVSFMERALPVDAFAPSRRIGVGFDRGNDGYHFAAMAFGSSIDGKDRGRGLAARFAVAPIHSASTVLHFGLAAVSENPASKVDFDTTPESRVADEDLVNTGRIDEVDRVNRIGIESAWRSGPLSVQAEWMRSRVQRSAGAASARLDGWYVAGSWVLSDESRPYKNGEFKGIAPVGRTGAWELTARFSRIDLDDSDIRGGRERNVTIGLNYYANDHLRIMANIIQVHSERRGQRDNPSIVTLRAQLTY